MFSINYKKVKKFDLESAKHESSQDNDYNPFEIRDLQSYLPTYTRFFEMDDKNYNKIALNHRYQVHDLKTVYDTAASSDLLIEKPIFVKYSPVLDPLHFLRGKYNLETEITRTLPKFNETCLSKLMDVNNASYVDGFFSYLTSMMKETHGWIHGIEYYGSFMGVQRKFRYNIADDLDFVMNCPYFVNNMNKYFTVDLAASSIINKYSGEGSRSNKSKLAIDDADDAIVLDFENLSPDSLVENTEEAACGLEVEYESKEKDKSESSYSDSSSSSDNESDNSESESSHDESKGSDWETESGSESGSGSGSESEYEDEEQMFSYLNEFPVQLIFQEKCTGTFDKLIMQRQLNDEQFIDTLMQITMMLSTYQKMFNFTHNDLHTNNVMFVETDKEFLYYKIDGLYYKVPTNGRIFKLIDFGRSIYKFGSKTFFSDSFAPSGDASTQYNCEPFMNPNKPRIDPNPSFDLCRLGCSIFDFVCRSKDLKTPLQKLVDSWCNDDFGKSVLYKSSGQERYLDFKLYKMIARTVNNIVPRDQLKTPIFSKYVVVGDVMDVMDIDAFPVYYA